MYRTVYESNAALPMPIDLNPEVLVIGGGIVGMTIALELAGEGVQVHVAEKGETLGGGIRDLRFFYDRPDNVQQWIEEMISDLEGCDRIRVLKGATLKRLDGQLGRFEALIRMGDGGETTLSPSAVVAATGCIARPAEAISNDGRCIGLSDMEKLLAESSEGPFFWKGLPLKTVSFILDLSNDDIKIHTVNAIKQAVILQDNGCQVFVVARNLKVSVSGMEYLSRQAREKGVIFFKYEEPPVLSRKKDGINVEVQDTTVLCEKKRETVSLLSDLVVTAETLVSDPETRELYRLMKLRTVTDDIWMEDNPQFMRIMSNRRGIFLAGACRFPQIVTESLSEAHAVVEEIKALFLKGTYIPENPVAEVDPLKCAVCYTCVRLCPHAAVRVERYGNRTVYAAPLTEEGSSLWQAARIEPAACFGCGICVAECPAKAITLYK